MEALPNATSVPRSLRYVSVFALAAAVLMIFLGAWRVGVTWDEPLHVEKLNNYLDTGWYLNNGQIEHGAPVSTMTHQYVYAPVTMLILHGLGVATGVEHWGAASASADAYAVRHVGIGLISLVGLLAAMATARLLFRRWDWALVSGAVLVAVPLWTGHSMFNIKDVSVATGYSMLTFGLALLARDRYRDAPRLRLVAVLAIAAGSVLAVGTRPGMWTGVGVSVVALIVCTVLQSRSMPPAQRRRNHAALALDLAIALVLAALLLLWAYPNLFGSPVEVMVRSVRVSTSFVGDSAPRGFVPARVLMQTPFVLLGFFGFGTFMAARCLLRSSLRPGVFETRLTLVLAQALALPLVAIVHGANLYEDLRQLMFSLPATALIITLGIERLVVIARSGADRNGPPMVAGLACIAIVLPLVDQATLFPFNYAYYSPLAKVASFEGDGDYYRASGREIAPSLPVGGRIVCSPQPDKKGTATRMAHLDGWVECSTAMSSPIAPYAPTMAGPALKLRDDEFWSLTFGSRPDVAKNCDWVESITRRSGWRRVYVSTLSRCTRPFPVLTESPVTFVSTNLKSFDYPDLGWYIITHDGSAVGVKARGTSASMKFKLDRALLHQHARIVLETERGTLPTLTFGGVAVQALHLDHGKRIEIRLGAEMVDRAIGTALPLEFRSSNGQELNLKILRMRVLAEPAAEGS